MNKETFTHLDLGDHDLTMSYMLARLTIIRAEQCADALLVMRQTRGTDFPPFFSIESRDYFNECNADGEFELLCEFND